MSAIVFYENNPTLSLMANDRCPSGKVTKAFVNTNDHHLAPRRPARIDQNCCLPHCSSPSLNTRSFLPARRLTDWPFEPPNVLRHDAALIFRANCKLFLHEMPPYTAFCWLSHLFVWRPTLEASQATVTGWSSSTPLHHLSHGQAASPFGEISSQFYQCGVWPIVSEHPPLRSCHTSNLGICTSLALNFALSNDATLCDTTAIWGNLSSWKPLSGRCRKPPVSNFSTVRPRPNTKLHDCTYYSSSGRPRCAYGLPTDVSSAWRSSA